jgi:hypothetical protein
MPPSQEQESRARQWLDSVVEIDCRSGIYDEANIIEAMDEIIGIELGEASPELLAEYAARVRAGLEAQAREEATWTERTTNDRIDDAFADLDACGILTGQAVGNTMQDGTHRMVMRGEERGGGLRGIAFYHRQDLENAVDGHGLHIAFGGWESDEDAAVEEVGREIVHVLGHQGVGVTWDGSATTRIQIDAFAWQRRRVTKGPAGPGPAPALPPKAIAPPPPVCTICNGRGWVTKDPKLGSEFCVCQKR